MLNYLEKQKHTLEILSDGDECFEIWLDGNRISSLNHDEHGWDGIEASINVAKEISKIIGAEIIEGEIDA